MIDLDRIEALANAATLGPWYADEERRIVTPTRPGDPRTPHDDITGEHSPGETQCARDNAFIAEARTAVTALVAELRAARAEVERLRTAAADERADVVAWMRRQGWSRASYDIRDGAHVGAAKGGDHG